MSSTSLSPSATTILPCISVGAVGQLAIDVIVDNMPSVHYIGPLTDFNQFVLPVTGAHPTEATKLAQPVELYQSADGSINVIQQRSGVLRHEQPAYLSALVEALQTTTPRLVVCTTSCYAAATVSTLEEGGDLDAKPTKSPIRIVATTAAQPQLTQCATLLSTLTPVVAQPSSLSGKPEYRMSGGGCAQHLFERCEALNIPLLVLCHEVNESDGNTMEAMALADVVMQVVRGGGKLEVRKQWDYIMVQRQQSL